MINIIDENSLLIKYSIDDDELHDAIEENYKEDLNVKVLGVYGDYCDVAREENETVGSLDDDVAYYFDFEGCGQDIVFNQVNIDNYREFIEMWDIDRNNVIVKVHISKMEE